MPVQRDDSQSKFRDRVHAAISSPRSEFEYKRAENQRTIQVASFLNYMDNAMPSSNRNSNHGDRYHAFPFLLGFAFLWSGCSTIQDSRSPLPLQSKREGENVDATESGSSHWSEEPTWMKYPGATGVPNSQASGNSPDGDRADDASDSSGIRFPTMGGKQFWTDFHHLQGWRIQQNAWSGHFRLLDPNNRRSISGSKDECYARLAEIAAAEGLEPMTGDVVILLHGLGRSRSSMNNLADYLSDELGVATVNLSYASTRREISDHAVALRSVIDGLPQAERIHFVAHSMGNIVIRHYLADLASADVAEDDVEGLGVETNEDDQTIVDSDDVNSAVRMPFGRFVMLAPPNQGSAMAEIFKRNPLFHAVWGRSGKELSRHWDEVAESIATPDFEFGIIAGGNGSRWGTNPLISGDDDLIVAVDETRLPGASDFYVIRAAHTFIMDDDAVQQATASFLSNGYFRSEEERERITEDE